MPSRSQRFISGQEKALSCAHEPASKDYPPMCSKCGYKILLRNGEWVLAAVSLPKERDQKGPDESK